MSARSILDAGGAVAAGQEAIAASVGVRRRAVGSFSGAETSMVLLASPGVGLRIEVMGYTFSVDDLASTVQLTTTEEDSAPHQFEVGAGLGIFSPFWPLLRSREDDPVNLEKTADSTVHYEVWYRYAAV